MNRIKATTTIERRLQDVSKTSFHARIPMRLYSTSSTVYYRPRNTITMMPEGPEVRVLIDQIRPHVVSGPIRLLDIEFVSGRYVKNGPPESFDPFANTMTKYHVLSSSKKQQYTNQPKNPASIATTAAVVNRTERATANLTTMVNESLSSIGPSNTTIRNATHDNEDTNNEMVDIVLDWNCKGKFIYMVLDNGHRDRHDPNNPDYQRSIWITLGMTGRFISEKAYQEQLLLSGTVKHIRYIIQLANMITHKVYNIYYQDQREFGTIKFCCSHQMLMDKLSIQLGLDILNPTITEDDFIALLQKQPRQTMNICKFCMDQTKLCGIGNYIVAEGLYRAMIDPFCAIQELSIQQQQSLFQELRAVASESYQSLTFHNDNKNTENDDDEKLENITRFEFQCYGKQYCTKYNEPVIRETNGPHGRTIWYTERQLFMSRTDRQQQQNQKVEEQQSTIPPMIKEESFVSSSSSSSSDNNNKPSVAKTRATTKNKKKSSSTNELTLIPDSPSNDEKKSPFKKLLTLDNIATFLSSSSSQSTTAPTSGTLDDIETATAVNEIQEDAINEAITSIASTLTDDSWKQVLKTEFQSDYFRDLVQFLEKERSTEGTTIYPPREHIFTALNECPLHNVKVVIIGQDPYHGPNQAHGLAFSILQQKQQQRIPPSLQNLMRELMDDIGIEPPVHGNLLHWSKQGVLLLNTVLTVRRGEANSHANRGWETFTDAILQRLNDYHKNDGIVYLLWGNAAATKIRNIPNNVNNDMATSKTASNIIIQTSHPSPLGATKTKSPFLGSKCFSRANKALIELGKDPIDWNLADD